MQDRYSKFDPDKGIPQGEELLTQIVAALPYLSDNVKEHIAWISNHHSLSGIELQHWLTTLRNNPSAGEALFRLSMASERLIAWITKDFAVDAAERIRNHKDADLACLLFVEIFVRVTHEFRSHLRQDSTRNAEQFVPFITATLDKAAGSLIKLDLPAEQLRQVLRYRSIENELMQTHEGKLTDDELSAALGLSVAELLDIRKLNVQFFGSNSV